MRKHRFSFLVFLLLIGTSISQAQVVINEYSCSNLNSFSDNFGEYEDWIELYNTSASAVNLTGYHLSDKQINPIKWALGNVTINANGFLRIWASGRGINTGTLHANFKLTQCKPEVIIFADAVGNILDSITLKSTQVGHSRGRITDGASTWSVFLAPTPAATNVNPYQEYATTPTMNISAGFYSSTQNITITTPDPNITIRYTTNGNTPTAASTAYSSPIAISTTSVLRAKAFSSTPSIPASFVESNTYFINSPHTTEVGSIYGDQITNWLTTGGPTSNTYPCGLEYYDKAGIFRTESYGEINKHGNDSWSYPQRGIDFISRDEYGYNYALLHPLFNLKTRGVFQRIILKAGANDNYPFENPGNPYSFGPSTQLGACHIRDAYVHTVSQKANLHLDERTWAPAVLYVNGNYWGVYDLREKADDQDFTHYYYNSPSKYATTPDQDSLQLLKTWGSTWSEYGGNTALNEWTALSNFITTNNMAVQTNFNYADGLLNTKSLTDYIILNSYCVNSAWLNWDTEWWRSKNVNATHKKWRYDLWDEDATFNHYVNYTGIPNQNSNADPCDPQTFGNPGGQGHIPILNALLQNPAFKQYYVTRYFDLLNTGLSCQRMTDILDSMINVITPEMPAQITRWNSSGGTYSQWQQNVQDLRNFILARCDSVINGFASCYGTTGPYQIKVNVVPVNSGIVDLNSLNLSSFVWNGVYPGGIDINLVAHSDSLYCFDYWEFQNHTPLPSINDSFVTVNLTMTDSIVAHFIPCILPVENVLETEEVVVIYPNPTTGKFRITSNKSQIVNIAIYNVLGEQIQKVAVSSKLLAIKNQTEIDLSKQPDGIYFIHVNTDQGIISKKLVLCK